MKRNWKLSSKNTKKKMIANVLTSKLFQIILVIGAFFTPLYLQFILIGVLVGFDLLTGILSSIKKNEVKGFFRKLWHIKSRGLFKSVMKLCLYWMFIGSVYLMEIAIFGVSFYVVNAITGIMALTELKSIAENCSYIVGGNVFVDAFKVLKDKLVDKAVDAAHEKEK